MTADIDHSYWAREILKYLVKHVRHFRGGEKFVYYGKLAKAIGYPEPHRGSFFAQRIGNTLGEMGHVIDNVVIDGEQSPYIQALVVSTTSKLPGDGIKEFYSDYPDLPKDKKKDLIAAEYQRIFEFGSRWKKMLEKLGVSADTGTTETEYQRISLHNPYGSEGSSEHRALRDYLYETPQVLDLSPINKYREYPLKSGDFVDVVFETGTKIVGVEVKSQRSGYDDLERGIFQCVKYKAVLESEAMLKNKMKPVSCILVIETELPRDLRHISNKLGVPVREKVSPRNA